MSFSTYPIIRYNVDSGDNVYINIRRILFLMQFFRTILRMKYSFFFVGWHVRLFDFLSIHNTLLSM